MSTWERAEFAAHLTEKEQETRNIRRLQIMMSMVMSVISQDHDLTVEEASELAAGAKRARLIENAGQIDWAELAGVNVVALSAGASAPEVLVAEVIKAFRARYDLTMQEAVVTREDVEFRLPRALIGA